MTEQNRTEQNRTEQNRTEQNRTEQNLVFFLGGKDAEMVTIKELLQAQGAEFHDKELGWGARAASYQEEIAAAVAAGKTPVLIELDNKPSKDWQGNDLPVISLPQGVVDVDHHNDRSNEAPSIIQVAQLLGVEPTREHQLIAANDAGYIPAMQSMGASQDEIDRIRALDRKTQGITEEKEQQAVNALSRMDRVGDMLVVRMEHSKSATVTDRLFGKQEQQNILILSGDGEVNYFGDGKTCATLKDKYPDGWAGGTGLGSEGKIAYFGGYPNHDEVLNYLTELELAKVKDKPQGHENQSIQDKAAQRSNDKGVA